MPIKFRLTVTNILHLAAAFVQIQNKYELRFAFCINFHLVRISLNVVLNKSISSYSFSVLDS